MSSNSLKHFVKGVQTVLPKLEIMGGVLEACGFKCEVNYVNNGQIGCRWVQGKMSMHLTLNLGDPDEIAWLEIWDNESTDQATVQATNNDGVAGWHIVFSDSTPEDSPLIKLWEDVARFLGHEDRWAVESADLHDEATVREIVNMFAVFFKRLV